MLKKIFVGIAALSTLYANSCEAQGRGCGVSPEYFLSKVKFPGGPPAIVVPSAFPTSAIDTCGHFAFYYEDLRIASLGGPAAGFADVSRGAALRSNMCDVVTYVEKVFDFSGISPTSKIRIYVDTSLSAALKPLPDTIGWGYDYGVGSAYYDGSPGSGVISGYVEKFIKTGTDPNPGDYHGTLQMNLYHSIGWPPVLSAGKSYADWYDWSNYYIGTGTAVRCEPDFFQRALHIMGHILGFAAFHRGLTHHTVPPTPSTLFTVMEDSLYAGADPSTTPSYFTSLTKARSGTTLLGRNWINNKPNPDNYPYWDMHLEDNTFYRPRMSPGDYQPNVMGQINDWGVMKRQFTKGDLEMFLNRIGLPPNPTTFSSSGTYAAQFNNHAPTSDRMASMTMSAAFAKSAAPEYLPVDYTLINNTGASLTINLTSLASDLRDADGDPITVMDGTLVNLRGCGEGGNNHALLTVNAAKNAITYTPREDYYGKSQFGFNLWDGKEKGAFVIFTINVLKGSAVSIPKGDNIVLSGDFEEGSEVRMLGNNVNNFCNNGYWLGKLGRLLDGHHFADSHPYDCYTNPEGNAIRGSYADCAAVDAGFGNAFTSFPWTGGGVAFGDASVLRVGEPEEAPDAVFPPGVTKNDRYMLLGGYGSLLYLGEKLQRCKMYKMEFDIRHRFAPGEKAHTYGPVTSISIGFTDSSNLIDPLTRDTVPNLRLLTYNQMLPDYNTTGVSSSAWKHETLYFTYCNDNASDILYFGVTAAQGGGTFELIDNISIKEMDEIPLSVNITQEQVSRCETKLIASDIINGCEGISFEWRVKGTGTIIATGREFTPPSPNVPTIYEVTVFDGCHTVKAEVELKPCRCSAGAVFGEPSTKITGSTYAAATLPAGYYHLDHDITVTSNCTFSDAKVLIEPGVTITVANDKKLIIERSHLLVCPDTNALWKGIVLANGGSEGTSARIEVRDSSLIEDAEIAIKAISPTSVFSGDVIISTNSVYNRNMIGIYIDNYKTSAAIYPFRFTGNVFTARLLTGSSFAGYPNTWPGPDRLMEKGTVVNGQANDKLHQQYAKALCKDSVFSNAGISLNEIGSGSGSTYYEIAVGGSDAPNLFDNMGFGIRMNNSNMSSYNNRFINISMLMKPVPRGTAPAYLYDASAGIFTYCNSPLSNYRLRVLPLVQGGGNTFHDCFTGILSINQARVQVESSTITSSHTLGDSVVPGAAYTDQFYEGEGIKVIGNLNQKYVRLFGNTISNMNEGIYLYLNNPEEGAVMEINNNSLFAANPDPLYAAVLGTDQYMLQGVEVFAANEKNNSLLSINSNILERVYNATKVTNLYGTRATINSNTINLRDKTMSTIGTPQYGIQMEKGWAANVGANNITTATLGIATQADFIKGVYATMTLGLAVCSNSVSNIGRSFEFDGMDAQTWTVWTNNTMQNAWKGFTLNSPIGDQVVVAGTNRPAGNKWLGTWSPTQPNTFATVNSISSRLFVRTGAGLSENPINNIGLPPIFRYDMGSGSILAPSTTVFTCYPASSPLIKGNALAEAVLTDSLDEDIPAVNLWMTQFDMYKTTLKFPDLRDSIGKLDTFMTAAANSRYQWLANIEAALADGNTATAQSLLISPVPPMGRVQVGNSTVVVNDVSAASYVVGNYLRYYGIYLRFLDSTLTGTDTASLRDLALKCPAIDGGVVYQARGLLRLLTRIVEEYQDQDCTNSGLYRLSPDTETEGGQQAYSLFPNPNQGSFTIRQKVVEDKGVRLKVYNAIGMEVYQSYSTFKAGKLNVSLTEQIPGLYLVCIDDEIEKTTCLRFIIK